MTACPTCGKPTETGFRPFCSKRCSDLDLARWLSGDYRIPGHLAEEDEAATETGLPRREEG